MSAGLQFVDALPGEPSGRHSEVAKRAESIKANTPKWAKWPSKTGVPGVRLALKPYGEGYEVVGRKLEDETVGVFVRYVPAADRAASNGNGHAPQPASPTAPGRPKVKCPICAQFINIESGEDGPKALTRHGRSNPVCRAVMARRR